MSRHPITSSSPAASYTRGAVIFIILLFCSLTLFAQNQGGTITPGQNKSGTISAQGQSDQYTLTVTKTGMYTITMNGTSESMDCYLRITGNDISLEDDDGGGGLNSRITAMLNPGTYVISAQSYGGATGSYILSVQTSQARTIAVGQTATGSVTSPGVPEYYTLTIASPATVTIRLEGSGGGETGGGLDAYLTISGNGVSLQDDDSGGNLNAQIITHLNPGTYTIGAGGFEGATGPYTLSVQATQMQTITLGQTVTGNISSPGACVLYRFTLAAPTAVTIRMTATGGGQGGLDTYLNLDGNDMAMQDDDGGGGLNSMITTQLGAGTYVITAHGFGESTGDYTLSLTQGLTDGGNNDGNNDNQDQDNNDTESEDDKP